MSDSHPETLTDPEHSDQAGVASSPPQSGDEVKKERGDRKSKLFNKENYRAGVQQGLDRLGQTIKTRQAEREKDKREKDAAHSYSSAYKVRDSAEPGVSKLGHLRIGLTTVISIIPSSLFTTLNFYSR